MLALYPSNKLEHLSYLLSSLLKHQGISDGPVSLFRPQTILVESPGMQHWLNMALAEEHTVAMNLSFPLPVRFMWDTARQILGEHRVPKQSAYRREVLVWRIDAIIRSDAFSASAEAKTVNRYWRDIDNEDEASLQRLQLATALADVYEQYLLFRPQWLFAWENGESAETGSDDEAWQASIWRMLVAEEADHPARLHADAVEALCNGEAVNTLPDNIIVFAINTMAPQLIQFLDALGRHIDIHVFHLNPSVNYWGDVKSNKEQARLLREEGLTQWQESRQDNPLLGNLGQQGRDLFNLLTPLESYEVSAFELDAPGEGDAQQSLLHALQQDIFNAIAPDGGFQYDTADTSVSVCSAHTTLREVEALHDYLLGLMQAGDDTSDVLKPSDVVVMCPAIEEYAPFIEAVFHRVGAPESHDQAPPRIPCSIADRAPLDAEPMIAAFMQLLSLPDSRFEVSQIIDYLRLEPVQRKFRLNGDDIELMSQWLHQAHVHWGRDKTHKSRLLNAEVSETFSWAWGLKRLLLGMTMADSPQFVNDLLTVPEVEGQYSVLLGKLIQLLEQLQGFAQELAHPRTAQEWHQYLEEMKQTCFEVSNDDLYSWEALSRATADLVTHCEQAGFEDTLTLLQIRTVLVKKFTTPDAANHFLTGQVTFCSMLPMRSIPFKTVCILGLNDGEFPRQSNPLSIDLMSRGPRKQGDRSRRLEDRYLFLEALISARDYLYLSYQGRRGKDNTERQPSLVLAELLALLEQGYGFTPQNIKQLPLHPFSPANFTGESPGFESGWFRLASALQNKQALTLGAFSATATPERTDNLSVDELARAFDNPLKTFANKRLGVYLEESSPLLNDEEPFEENSLLRFNSIRAFVEADFKQQDKTEIARVLQHSGDFPDTPLTPGLLDDWQQEASALFQSLGLHVVEQNVMQVESQQHIIEARAWQGGDGLQMLHYGSQNTKRSVEQYLTLLCFNANGNALPLNVHFIKREKGEAKIYKQVYQPVPAELAKRRLDMMMSAYLKILQSPVPDFADIGAGLAQKYTGGPSGRQCKIPDIGFDEWLMSARGVMAWDAVLDNGSEFRKSISEDPYSRWFFPLGIQQPQCDLGLVLDFYVPLRLGSKGEAL